MSRLLTTPSEAPLQIFEELFHKDLETFTLNCKRIHVIGESALQKHLYDYNITSLTFEQSLLDSESINNVIMNTFDLEHFKFSFDGREMNAAEEITREEINYLLRRT
ncbi:hypothetical protein ABVK25_002669 [Lepraria finkii]|uniref:F-box domain-containing protein n=1 Tax=Lepraria finkii TaxID=1340010 RepID=A0ABR4BGH8_9LECA